MEVKKGILYGVGVGPGDPELLTLKAVRLLQRCPVIAAPPDQKRRNPGPGHRAPGPVPGRQDHPAPVFLHGAGQDPDPCRPREGGGCHPGPPGRGEDVAKLNLGDVSIYATWGYVMEIVRAKGYQTAMVPGIPSFCAAAARLDAILVSWGSPLYVIPVGKEPLTPQLEQPGGKVLMKAGRSFPQIVEALKRTGQLDRAALVEDCGLPGERVCTDLGECPENIGYFATVIVKEK